MGTRPPVRNQEVLHRVDRLCSDLEPLVDDCDHAAVTQTRALLGEPLRLAVVGRVSAGKSTLVNALVGRRVAPTSAGECTRIVTWYRYGTPDRAEVRLLDGSTRRVELVDGAVPKELDVPERDVAMLTVFLQAGALRNLILIDTPGLDTLTAESEAATRWAILGGQDASGRAAGEADALLFMIGDAARQSDVDFLGDFHGSCGGSSATSLNVVGVVSQADRFGAGPFDLSDPFEIASAVAAGLAAAHPAEMSEVVAVSGLLAETARTGRVTEPTARRLADLDSLDPVTLSLRRQSSALADLFGIFGPYGVTGGRHQAVHGGVRLKTWCEAVSGIRALEDAVRVRLAPRAGLLKATRALGVLAVLAGASSFETRDRALALVEEAWLDPVLHPLDEMRVLNVLMAQVPDSPLTRQLQTFVDEGDLINKLDATSGEGPAELAVVAQRRATAATREASLALNPCELDAARVLARSYLLLARRLSAPVQQGSEERWW